jgi:hypothetical protein
MRSCGVIGLAVRRVATGRQVDVVDRALETDLRLWRWSRGGAVGGLIQWYRCGPEAEIIVSMASLALDKETGLRLARPGIAARNRAR